MLVTSVEKSVGYFVYPRSGARKENHIYADCQGKNKLKLNKLNEI